MKITNDHLFKLMEIIGIIGLDVDLEGDNEQKVGMRIIETLLKNANQAQTEIEDLVGDLTGVKTDNPMGLLKAITKIKQDKELVDFFTEALNSLT